jgi:beta-fructofuranosidase
MKVCFEDFITKRQQLAGDPHRPLYHFLAPCNWMNDPNGLFYWQSRYHLFYQFNPTSPLWGKIHWGHASSPDLVHWEDHPVALQPDKGTGDANGCWSGCIVDKNATPTAVYTGFVTPNQTPVVMAQAKDNNLILWEKSPHNPVVDKPPADVRETDFRDPYVWKEEEHWKMLIGAGMLNGECAVLLYESTDLINWSYLGPLFSDSIKDTHTMWECPNFFRLGDNYVLLVSLFPDIQGVYYYIGKYDGETFQPESQGYFETGRTLYAPHVRWLQADLGDRCIMFGWLREDRNEEAIERAGWAGVQSFPRELLINPQGALVSRPVAELALLRQESQSLGGIQIKPGERYQLTFTGNCLEVEALIEAKGGLVGVEFLATPDREEVTRLWIDFDRNQAVLDTSRASLSLDSYHRKGTINFRNPSPKQIKMHLLIDRSVIEIWFNDEIALTGRAYPTRGDAKEIAISTISEQAGIPYLKVWEIGTIWPVEKG